ncbi:hypothetical protein KHA94_24285 [Bacillus sp. FJAT-49705]|uniref:DUF6884 domain-containing protein n=1 Tax=Cytobacillus citreus TaxID=2833586 RepID=A0ABS5NZF1_9BACI|nr:DUF6884 domain-containing protein [Cytobacillus citreus]MBS4193215.1 hypothetical protein [Cytobacillus citreus]
MKIAFVCCTKLKEEMPCSAKEMYLKSTLFKKATIYIESKDYVDWFILSAKYGLLRKQDVIEPYDVTLNSKKASERLNWSKRVLDQIEGLHQNVKQADFYVGKKYREYLITMLEQKGIKCKVPLEGKGIGDQLSFYTKYSNK